MRKLLAPLVLFLFAFTPVADDWKTVKLMDKVTVSMPGTPSVDNKQGISMQTVVLADKSEVSAFALDYSTFGMTEEVLQAMAGTDEFKQQMETMISMQPGIKLLKNEPGKYNDKYFMYDMELQVDNKDYKGIMEQRTILYKSYGITIMYKTGSKGADADLKKRVFNSLQIGE